jgi:diguanylate cyclase (GGDEF)-like protein
MEGGQNIDSAIDSALTEAQCVIVVWSRKSIDSRWVRDEAEEALNNAKLLPILAESAIRPPYGFRRVSAVDMTEWDGTATAALFQELLSHIESRLGIKTKATREEWKDDVALDELTRIPNRQLFEDRLRQALARAQRARHDGNKLALMFLDLDGFKQVNDRLGHSAGDDLLRQTAERIKSCVRKTDTVFRLGGDEFTVILEDIDGAETAASKAQEIADKIKDNFELPNGVANVTASIGVAIYPADGESRGDLLQAADQAMYSAKREKRDYQLFNPSIRAKIARQLTWENDLRQALERNEYVVFYQPIFTLSGDVYRTSQRVVGIEALIRWVHLRERFVPPSQFIPFLEKTRLIEPVGEWVLRTACGQNKRWQDEGFPIVPISVNVSTVQIMNRAFAQVVNNALADTHLQPNYLQLEISADALLAMNFDEAREAIGVLREMGVHIALDRFGTGCSPLSNLEDFLIDAIKMKWPTANSGLRSENGRRTAITNSIVQLARGLKAQCVAVGVESKESLYLLNALGIEQVQGELFAGPQSNDELKKYWQGRIEGNVN